MKKIIVFATIFLALWSIPRRASSEPLTLCARYLGEDKGKVIGADWFHVHYFTPAEQAQHEVIGRRGRATWKHWNMDVENGSYFFVLTLDRRLIISRHFEYGRFHHSTLAAGQPVLSAGIVNFYKGIIASITPHSGHYKPTGEHLDEAVDYFNSQGVFVRKVDKLPRWATEIMEAE